MPDLKTLSSSVSAGVLSVLDRKFQMIMLLLLLVSLAVFAGPACATGGTDVVVTKGERADVPPSWPKGAGEVVNDASRTSGWHPWFSEWPNDVNQYAFEIKSTDDLNRLIAKLAAIKTELRQIRLCSRKEPRGLGWVTTVPEGNGIAAIFSIGNQKYIDEWYKQLGVAIDKHDFSAGLVEGVVASISVRSARRFGKMTFLSAPIAIPPTLTVFVQNELVELNELKIPAGMDVCVGNVPSLFHDASATAEGTVEVVARTPDTQGTQDAAKSVVKQPVSATQMQIERFLNERKRTAER